MRDWLPEGHLAYFVLEIVDELDLSAIFAEYERELRGYPPYNLRMMTALVLYAYATGTMSSRGIARETKEDVAYRVISGNQSPDHSSIAEFRKRHGEVLGGLFVQVLQLCKREGLVRLGHVALDGTKLKANASKHKALSYGRMQEEEARLRNKVKELLVEADKVDSAEDAQYGKGRLGDELPEELRHTRTRLSQIREAKKALEEEAQAAQAEENAGESDESPTAEGDLPQHLVPHTPEGKPAPKAQRNFTDSESRIMKTGDTFTQGFNGQASVDSEHQIIVVQALTNQPADVNHLAAMIERIVDGVGELPQRLTADAGYFSAQNVSWVESLGVKPYIATRRQKHGEPPPLARGRPPTALTARQRMARKLETEEGRRIYSKRKAVVEPVFGQIKSARGIREVLRRGLKAARQEWALICTTHNLLKLFRNAVLA